MSWLLALCASSFLSLPSSAEQTHQCVTCASSSLRSRWAVTGLPGAALSDELFRGTTTCNEEGGMQDAHREPCSGPCFSLLFDDPDVASTTGKTPLVVRGCHSSLFGISSERTTSGGATAGVFCEFDGTLQRPSSRGVLTPTRTLIEFCQNELCNAQRTAFPNTEGGAKCDGQIFNSTLSGTSLECYECDGLNENCWKNRCTKKYCAKSIVKLENAFVLRKYCSNVNVLGVDNACVQGEVSTTPGGAVAVTNKFSQCFCKDQQYCNSTHDPLRFFPMLFVSLLLPFLLKHASC